MANLSRDEEASMHHLSDAVRDWAPAESDSKNGDAEEQPKKPASDTKGAPPIDTSARSRKLVSADEDPELEAWINSEEYFRFLGDQIKTSVGKKCDKALEDLLSVHIEWQLKKETLIIVSGGKVDSEQIARIQGLVEHLPWETTTNEDVESLRDMEHVESLRDMEHVESLHDMEHVESLRDMEQPPPVTKAPESEHVADDIQNASQEVNGDQSIQNNVMPELQDTSTDPDTEAQPDTTQKKQRMRIMEEVRRFFSRPKDEDDEADRPRIRSPSWERRAWLGNDMNRRALKRLEEDKARADRQRRLSRDADLEAARETEDGIRYIRTSEDGDDRPTPIPTSGIVERRKASNDTNIKAQNKKVYFGAPSRGRKGTAKKRSIHFYLCPIYVLVLFLLLPILLPLALLGYLLLPLIEPYWKRLNSKKLEGDDNHRGDREEGDDNHRGGREEGDDNHEGDREDRTRQEPATAGRSTAEARFQRRVEEHRKKMGFGNRLRAALWGGLAVTVPMLVMAIRPTLTKSLVATVVAVFVFGIALAMASAAQPQEMLAGTAAYAAVLAVFVGTSLPGK